MPTGRLGGTAFITGGGRGIGASIARELAAAGMRVAATGRTAEQVRVVAQEIGGTALVGDVSSRKDVQHWVREAGALDLARIRLPPCFALPRSRFLCSRCLTLTLATV